MPANFPHARAHPLTYSSGTRILSKGPLARCLNFVQPAMDSSFKIVIVDENPIRAAILEDGLREAGHARSCGSTRRRNLLARIYAHRSRRDPDRPGKSEPRRAGADVPGQPRREAADRHVRRPERRRLDRGRRRRRRLGLHRRRAAEGAHQEHPRSLHLALQRILPAAERTRPHASPRSKNARSSIAPRAF